jgi:hypothetical protein
VGNISKVLIPVLLVGAGVVGVFAAKTYNEGAECVSSSTYREINAVPDLFTCLDLGLITLLAQGFFA